MQRHVKKRFADAEDGTGHSLDRVRLQLQACDTTIGLVKIANSVMREYAYAHDGNRSEHKGYVIYSCTSICSLCP